MKTVAVLALQGGFIEHIKILNSLSIKSFEIRKEEDIKKPFDALIIPGGESSVISKLLHNFSLFEEIKTRIKKGMPIFGTCAGAILLANDLEGREAYFKTMEISIKPNGYGSQLDSFIENDKFGDEVISQIFVRAPIITKISNKVSVLSKTRGIVTAARQENQLVTTYHPELITDAVHKYFLGMDKN